MRQLRRMLLFTLVLLPGLGAAQTPESVALGNAGQLDRPARIYLVDMPLLEALTFFEQRTSIALAYSPSLLPNARVSCACVDSTAAAALRTILRGTGFTFRGAQDQVVLVPVERPNENVRAREQAPAPFDGPRQPAASPLESQRLQEPGLVTGRVTSPAATPLTGALISIRGGTRTALTDAQGVFRLQIPASDITGRRDTLRVTHLGYRTAALPFTAVSGTQRMDVTMSTDVLKLDEIVVTGTAGNQARRAQPAVISRIDAAAIVDQVPTANMTQVLKGRLPGITITDASGTTGTSARINIRGAASVSLSNEPLVFIDGVRLESGQRSLIGVGGQTLSSLNDLNPADVLRVEVVKGPAAATLYGADASAGVIQIFTKRGTVGVRSFQQSIALEYDQIQPDFTPYTNYGTCTAAQVAPTSGHPLCSGLAVGAIVQDNPLVREGAFRDGEVRSLQYSLQGGAENYGYYASFSTHDEDGAVRNNSIDRRTGRANFNWTASQKVTVNASVGLARNEVALPPGDQNSDGYMIAAGLGTPGSLRRNADGTIGGGWLLSNQSVASISSIESKTLTTRMTPSVQVDYRPLPWLKHRITFGADLNRSSGTQFYPKNAFGWYQGDLANGWVRAVRSNADIYTVDYLGNIQNSFGGGVYTSDLSFGAQFIDRSADALSATGIGLVTNASNLISGAATNSAGEGYSRQKSLGLLMQEQIGYRDRLFLQLGARVDRNSSFGVDADAFFLPKAGVSYLISDETFWAGLRDVFSTARLRTAWGTTGRAPTPGASLQTYASIPYVTDAGTLLPGLIPLNPGNPALKPERGREFEAGIDLGLWDNRAGLELTFYDKRTTDLLLQVPQPPSSGFTGGGGRPFQNIGKVLNRGFEFAFRITPVERSNVRWEAALHGTTLHNELVSLGSVDPFINSYRAFRPGQQIGAWYVNRIRSIDAANNRVIVSEKAEFLGNQMPTMEGSLTSTLSLFRNLKLYAQLDTKRGHRVYNLGQEYRDRVYRNSRDAVLPAEQGGFTAEERLLRFGPYVAQRADGSFVTVPFTEVKEDYIQKADFIRLSEVSATVDIPASLLARLRVKQASLTVGGRNLGLWTDFEGYDPEVLGTGPGTAGSSFYDQFNSSEVFTLPPMRRWLARINVQF